MIKGIEHAALSVSDLDRSMEFYRDVMGLEVIRVLECDVESPLGKVVGLNPCKARIAHLQRGEVMLELFEYQNPRGEEIKKSRTQADHGYIHIGFTSTDTRADYERLRSHGVEFISEPVEFRPGVWIVYFHGPDGEVCELRQT